MAEVEVEEFGTILEAMEHLGIFSITKHEDGFQVWEECDSCLHAKLTKSQLKMLGEEIIKLAGSATANCKIFGSEISFEKIVPEDKIQEVCQDIWDNPGKYSDYENETESAYYSFLKFLWVEYPDGSSKRLGAIII